MPYPSGHRDQVKKRIIESARRLFNQRGFDNVSLYQIMAGAGLTHGGFYSYFQSKSDLYAEVLGCFFTDPNWKNCWEGVHVDLSSTDVGPQVVRAYLSREHFDDVEHSCPMVALPTDVARSGPPARQAFETVFKAMVSVLERSGVHVGRPELWRLALETQIGGKHDHAAPKTRQANWKSLTVYPNRLVPLSAFATLPS